MKEEEFRSFVPFFYFSKFLKQKNKRKNKKIKEKNRKAIDNVLDQLYNMYK